MSSEVVVERAAPGLAPIMIPIVLGVVVLDQLSKYLILAHLPPDGVRVIPGFFDLTLAFNKGAAFGMMAGLSDGTRQLLLSVTTLVALTVVLVLLKNHYRSSRAGVAALSLVLGGAMGNIIDRLRIGKVVDFFDVYWEPYHWPAFNVADSAICIGVAILLFLRPAPSRDRSSAPSS